VKGEMKMEGKESWKVQVGESGLKETRMEEVQTKTLAGDFLSIRAQHLQDLQ
jgi:hypothetical protein